MAEEEKDNGAPAEADATQTDAATDTSAAVENSADDDDIDYDAVSIDDAETGDDEPAANEDDAEEVEADDADADAEPEYSTGQPPGDVERNSGLGAAAGQPELADALGSLPADKSERPEIPGTRAYELIFIARSSAADSVDEITQRVSEIVEGGEGVVDHTRKSELRRLAYPIKKETEGYYIVINSRFRPATLPELERMLKLEERILRFMIIREDD